MRGKFQRLARGPIAVHVVVTGASGFIGKNLSMRLRELRGHCVTEISRCTRADQAAAGLSSADFVFHLTDVSRSQDDSEFVTGNAGSTQALRDALMAVGRRTPVAIARAIEVLARDRVAVREVGLEARRSALLRFDSRVSASKRLEMYHRVCSCVVAVPSSIAQADGSSRPPTSP